MSCIIEENIFKIVASNNIKGLEHFIRASRNITIKDGLGRNIFMIAVIKGHSEMMDFIMSSKEIDINDIDYEHNNALMMSVRKGNLAVVKMVIELGVDISYQSIITGLSPLMEASMRGYLKIVKVLANKNDANALDNEGNNALMIAAKCGRPDIVSYLSNFTDINNKNNSGYTALMLGVRTNSIEVVEKLIELGADIAIKSNDRKDALMIAFCKGNLDIIKLLLTNGAYIYDVNKNEETELVQITSKDKYLTSPCIRDALDILIKEDEESAESLTVTGEPMKVLSEVN